MTTKWCSSCRREISEPSASLTANYARFWRDNRCYICDSRLLPIRSSALPATDNGFEEANDRRRVGEDWLRLEKVNRRRVEEDWSRSREEKWRREEEDRRRLEEENRRRVEEDGRRLEEENRRRVEEDRRRLEEERHVERDALRFEYEKRQRSIQALQTKISRLSRERQDMEELARAEIHEVWRGDCDHVGTYQAAIERSFDLGKEIRAAEADIVRAEEEMDKIQRDLDNLRSW